MRGSRVFRNHTVRARRGNGAWVRGGGGGEARDAIIEGATILWMTGTIDFTNWTNIPLTVDVDMP